MKKETNDISLLTLGKLLLSFSLLIIGIYAINNTYSVDTTSTAWDGVTVASSFAGGNGSENNPYQINNGEQLAYFKQLIESDDYENYIDKNYVLTNDVNLGDNEFEAIGNSERFFAGTLNGNGNIIYSFKQTKAKIIGESNYYGLFAMVNGATIKNINISSVNIIPESAKNIYIGGLIGQGDNNTLENVSIVSLNVDLQDNENSIVGGVFGEVLTASILNNVFVNISTLANKDNYIGGIVGKVNDLSMNNVVTTSNIDKSLSDNKLIYGQKTNELNMDTVYTYQVVDNSIILDQQITIEDLINNLNNTNDFEWFIEDNLLKLREVIVKTELSLVRRGVAFTNNPIVEHNSGIADNVVYVNDFVSDYNYYMGLNYTTATTNDTPTIDNKNLYSDNNLVRLQINYNGTETLTNGQTLTGYVSKDERQTMYVYYKMLAVETMGTTDLSDDYVLIELIDNPFTDRPENKGFNNWITNYPGVEISYDYDYYVRYAKVPISYTNGIPNDINIDFTASWVDASVEFMNTSTSWENVFSGLETSGMHELQLTRTYYEPYDMTGYFREVILNRNESYAGYYNNRGQLQNSGTCRPSGWFGGTCTYYELIENENFIEGEEYYELVNTYMEIVDTSDLPLVLVTETNEQYVDANMSGYYEMVTVPYNQSLVGYYNSSGQLQTSGTCNTSSGCNYYKLIQYYDELNNENIYDNNKTYYYLTTRDTNIVVLSGNISSSWASGQSKPFTFTSVYNDYDYRNNVTWTVSGTSVRCYADTVIENIKINSGQGNANTTPGSGTTTSRYLFGNWNNLKVGRGITQNGNYKNFLVVMGGSNSATGSSSNITRYRLTIESGKFNSLSLTVGNVSTWNTTNVYAMAQGVYGNDYDRVTENNSDLDIYYCASGSWGGNIYGEQTTSIGLDLKVKSGSFGSGKYDNTTGIYIGGRQSGTHYTSRRVVYEGGYTYNLIGGPVTASNRSNINDSHMYIKGGSIDMITGGAGQTATYGNRIVQLTGGMVNYSVFAGSNGYDGGSSDGTVNGDGYIYLGGNAIIGSDDNVSNNRTLFGAEAGSVFGIGNGRSEYTSVGSSDNANIIVTGNSHVKRNVYGGGNYGATGISSTGYSTETKIQIHGGTIDGSVYGGGNQNGSGSTSIDSLIDILVDGGLIKGSVYGGSNQKGTIYGDVQLNITGGVIENDVYGGGYGGYQSGNQPGTYVTGNVDLKIGSTAVNAANITGSVYGGSAFGTVNGTRDTANNEATTNVVVNDGIVTQAVFGGGRGSASYTPYVRGNINVNINGGNIGSVYGGNDASGIPEKDVYVNLNGGVVGNAFGGGNNSSINTTNITLKGGTVTNLYGGSNLSGNVTKTNVSIISGNVVDIYGGNNIGGSVTNTEVILDGGNITGSIYGGGNEATTGDTKVILNQTDVKIPYIYGGGKQANASNTSIDLFSGDVGEVYGGSNINGNVATSNIVGNGAIKKGEAGGVDMDITYKTRSVSWESEVYPTIVDITVTLKNLTPNSIGTYSGLVTVADSILYSNYSQTEITEADGTYSFSQANRYYGSNFLSAYGEYTLTFTVLTYQSKDNLELSYELTGKDSLGTVYADSNLKSLAIDNMYGGNNHGGVTNLPTITIENGSVKNIYGGGNEASVISPNVIVNGGSIENVYGGGNNAGVNASTKVDINGGKVTNNVYGGGNQGTVAYNTEVVVENASIGNDVYAGGNGATAVVNGNTLVRIGGKTVVGDVSKKAPHGSVFGGGNAAATGTEENKTSTAIVDIAGATIYGNIYGGANTSVVYGETLLNIGYNTKDMSDLIKDDIHIKGTVYGGGEANASGSENYDYSFISVTDGIVVNIDGGLYDNFNILGSIFGSGNASSTTGTSEINITNYGTKEDIKKNISIQRTEILTVKNSHFELVGATDRTNEYSDYLYTLSRIDNLKLANDSSLYLQTGANLLKKFTSLKMDNTEQIATVDIDSETKTVTKNVNNRLYLLEGKNLNIATNESTTSFGQVEGMTFFGMYTYDRDGKPITGMYDQHYNYGDTATANDLYLFIKGSYVLGLHNLDHDITKDGFYSNYDDNGGIKTNYIEPTPEDSNFYMWIIGEVVTEYQLNLVASKYSTLGAVELPLLEFSQGNTQFVVLDFNYNGLEEGISLIDPNNIPRIAATSSDADSVMGLSMRSSNTGWLTVGRTNFMSDVNNQINGTTTYKSENSTSVPTLLFYLYHSKNLETSGDLGNVTISLMAITRIDDLTNETKRLVINVDMSRALYTTNDYEGGITPGREYEMFAPTLTNITSKSAFSTYYSLYANANENLYKTGYHRSLVSSYVLPENTEMTLIDLSTDNLEYYYYVVNGDDVVRANLEYEQHREASYDFSKFRRMGSTTDVNKYSDATMNDIYYDAINKVANEEFIVIVDFADTNIETDSLNNSLLIELRNQESQTMISVLGIEQSQIVYNLYANKNAVIDLVGTLDENVIYKEDIANLVLDTNFLQSTNISNTVYDTNFFDKKLGIKLTILDSEGNPLNGTSIFGLYYEIDGEKYYPRIDGTTRIAISDKVANVKSRIKIHTSNLNLASGTYSIEVESFASPDGIYYGLDYSDRVLVPFTFVNKVFGLKVTSDEKSVILNKESGKTLNGNNSLVYSIDYFSGLANPNIRLSLYRRMYDKIYTNQYELVDLKDFITNNYPEITNKSYQLTTNPVKNMTMIFETKPNLPTGTYKFVFGLYDGNNYIGDVKRYVIVE